MTFRGVCVWCVYACILCIDDGRIADTLHEDHYTFFCHFSLNFSSNENVSDKGFRKIKTTHFVFNNFFFFFEIHALYEIMWKKYCIGSQATWRMRFACLITKDTDRHSEYVILITFPLQQRLYIHAPQCFFIRTLRVSNNHAICSCRQRCF